MASETGIRDALEFELESIHSALCQRTHRHFAHVLSFCVRLILKVIDQFNLVKKISRRHLIQVVTRAWLVAFSQVPVIIISKNRSKVIF